MIEREDAALAYLQFEILSYLHNEPRGCDTIGGILDWWLYHQRLANGPVQVREAVFGLVREGRLRELKRQGAEPLYGAASSPIPTNQIPPNPRDPDEE